MSSNHWEASRELELSLLERVQTSYPVAVDWGYASCASMTPMEQGSCDEMGVGSVKTFYRKGFAHSSMRCHHASCIPTAHRDARLMLKSLSRDLNVN